jgi:hypothetical protein
MRTRKSVHTVMQSLSGSSELALVFVLMNLVICALVVSFGIVVSGTIRHKQEWISDAILFSFRGNISHYVREEICY